MLKVLKDKPFKVMVIGGTAESHQIIKGLLDKEIEVLITVATTYGESLLEQTKGLSVFQGRMDKEQMEKFILDNRVSLVVDASHPYAANVSVNAIEACENVGVSYVRFERESHEAEYSEFFMADGYEEAAKLASGIEGNIFLTTGSNNLEVFVKTIENSKNRLFVRVLPVSNVLQKCEELGLSANNIIAMKGPFSKELNEAMLKQCNAAVMVTKESGDAGGISEKLVSAKELGIKVVLIKRPKVEYKNIFSDIDEMLKFVLSLEKK